MADNHNTSSQGKAHRTEAAHMLQEWLLRIPPTRRAAALRYLLRCLHHEQARRILAAEASERSELLQSISLRTTSAA